MAKTTIKKKTRCSTGSSAWGCGMFRVAGVEQVYLGSSDNEDWPTLFHEVESVFSNIISKNLACEALRDAWVLVRVSHLGVSRRAISTALSEALPKLLDNEQVSVVSEVVDSRAEVSLRMMRSSKFPAATAKLELLSFNLVKDRSAENERMQYKWMVSKTNSSLMLPPAEEARIIGNTNRVWNDARRFHDLLDQNTCLVVWSSAPGACLLHINIVSQLCDSVIEHNSVALPGAEYGAFLTKNPDHGLDRLVEYAKSTENNLEDSLSLKEHKIFASKKAFCSTSYSVAMENMNAALSVLAGKPLTGINERLLNEVTKVLECNHWHLETKEGKEVALVKPDLNSRFQAFNFSTASLPAIPETQGLPRLVVKPGAPTIAAELKQPDHLKGMNIKEFSRYVESVFPIEFRPPWRHTAVLKQLQYWLSTQAGKLPDVHGDVQKQFESKRSFAQLLTQLIRSFENIRIVCQKCKDQFANLGVSQSPNFPEGELFFMHTVNGRTVQHHKSKTIPKIVLKSTGQ